MKHVKATTAFLTSAALVSALAGCSLTVNVPSPESTSPESTPSVVETASPTPEPAQLTLPGCDDLLTLDQAKSLMGSSTVFLGEGAANAYSPWFEVPAVRTALTGLTAGQSCWWGIPDSDGSFYVLVSKIDAATRASIESALVADGYSTAVVGARTVWSKEGDADFTYRAETHQFDGELWILSNGPDLDISGVAADTAFDAIRAANPSLGP